jgi:hypothetical protein
MDRVEFTKKVSSDEAAIQCNETTKDELEKLNKFIKENPSCLSPKDILEDLASSDDDSEDSDHYFHHIANPDKVISMKDLQINRLEKRNHFQTLEITNLHLTIKELNKNIAEIKLEKQKLENQDKFITCILTFMKTEFNMGGIDLEPNNEKSIQNFKDRMLDKAIEFSEIKKKYNELINWKDINEAIRVHFITLVETKYSQIYSTYSATQNDKSKNDVSLIVVSVLVLLLAIGYMFT